MVPRPADIRRMLKSFATPAAGERALITALATRTEELLPQEDFVVTTDGKVIRVMGTGQFHGKANILMPVFFLRVPLPMDQRLDALFESYGRRLQEFLSMAYGRPWPTVEARASHTVTNEKISVWWGGPSELEAVEHIRPIVRNDIGL
jgi:hypothetical protein